MDMIPAANWCLSGSIQKNMRAIPIEANRQTMQHPCRKRQYPTTSAGTALRMGACSGAQVV